MPRFVVLLRGVNVGKGNKLPMADFRSMLEGLGYSAVRTVLNSGNAVFTSPGRNSRKHAEAIAAAVQERFGIASPVMVKSAVEFAAIVTGNAIVPPQADHSRFLVAFAMDPAKLAGLDALQTLLQPGERFVVTEHAAYLHCTGGLLESKLAEAILGKAGRGITTRSWGTVLKLSTLLDGSAA